MSFRVAIIGPGALGRALGGVLERGGAEVGYIGRHGPLGALPKPLDLAIVTVKAYDTAVAVRGARPHVGDPLWLTLQNGVGNVQMVADVLAEPPPPWIEYPPGRVLGGATTHAARRLPSGEVMHLALGETWIAGWSGEGSKAAEIASRLTEHGLRTTVAPDLWALLFRKLAISCGVNGVTAIEGCTNGQLLERPVALERAVAVAREALAEARASGWRVDPREAAALIEEVCRRTAANRSSMLQDLEAGRRTEVEEIHGDVVRSARENNREAPLNAALMREIQEREKTARHA